MGVRFRTDGGVQEARATRDLGESEWSWIVLAARWPDFRGFLIRGGAERWACSCAAA